MSGQTNPRADDQTDCRDARIHLMRNALAISVTTTTGTVVVAAAATAAMVAIIITDRTL